MTGDQAKMGTDFKNGVALAVEEWNAKGRRARQED